MICLMALIFHTRIVFAREVGHFGGRCGEYYGRKSVRGFKSENDKSSHSTCKTILNGDIINIIIIAICRRIN